MTRNMTKKFEMVLSLKCLLIRIPIGEVSLQKEICRIDLLDIITWLILEPLI